MRSHTLRLLLLALTIAAMTLVPVAAAGAASVKSVEVSLYTYAWSPSEATIVPSEQVTFANSTPGVPHGIVWTSTAKPTSCDPSVPDGEGGKAFSSSASWSGTCTFSAAGTYTFRCYVHEYMKGSVTVTNPGAPVVTTEVAEGVTETDAQLHGSVNPDGHETTYHFKWGRTTNYEGAPTATETLAASSSASKVSAPLSKLAPGTTYHFRLMASNEKGTVEGADETFTTASPPGAPTASTSQASSVSETGATLNGTVNPDGESTKYIFEYGTNNTYGQQTAEVTLTATDHVARAVSAAVSGLAAGTHYHFRLHAMNASGPADGADGEFTTLSPPAPKESAKEPSPGPSPSPAPGPTPAPGSISPQPEIAPLVPPIVQGSPKLAALRHGSAVRGSLAVSQSGAGGRLEVDLIAKSASLARAAHPHRQAVVARLVRSLLPPGKVSFSVGLNARGRSALRRHHKLALIVKITLTPPLGKAVTLVRGVVLRA